MEEEAPEKLNLFIFILVIIFNSLQLLNQFTNRRCRLVFNSTSIYFVNTAISSLIIGISFLLYTTIKEEKSIVDTHTIEYSHGVLVRFSMVIKSLEVGMIVIVRFIAVRKVELYQKMNRVVLIKCVLFIWSVTLALVFVPYYLFGVSKNSYDNFFALFSALIVLPLTSLALILYTRTVLMIRKQRKNHFLHAHYCNSEKCRNLSTAKQKLNKPFQRIDEHFESHSRHSSGDLEGKAFVKRFEKIFETKTVRLVGLLVALFVVCWTPLTFYCIRKSNKYKTFEDDQTIDLLITLGLAYSILVPVLYMFYIKSSIRRSPVKKMKQIQIAIYNN